MKSPSYLYQEARHQSLTCEEGEQLNETVYSQNLDQFALFRRRVENGDLATPPDESHPITKISFAHDDITMQVDHGVQSHHERFDHERADFVIREERDLRHIRNKTSEKPQSTMR